VDNPVRNTPKLGMDADTNVEGLQNGKYMPNAYDIRHKTTNGNTTNNAQNILGNKFVYAGGSVTRQNKRIAIAINALVAGSGTITFKSSGNGFSFTTAPFTIPLNDVETAINNAVSAANTILSSFGGVSEITPERVVNSNTSASYVIEIGGLSQNNQGVDWNITVTGSQTILFDTQEAIPQGLTGDLIKTSNIVLNDRNFQLWTTQQELPETGDVVEASNATPIRITERTEHGLSVGDITDISGVKRNINANGRWFVGSVIDAFTYEILGSSPSGVTATISILSGVQYLSTGKVLLTTTSAHSISNGAKVFIIGSDASVNGESTATVISTTTLVIDSSTYVANFGAGGTIVQIANAAHSPSGLGEIGVVEIDVNNIHTYTRLLRSTEFNFRTKKQQDVVGEFYNNTYSIYWDDDYNTGRVFYYDYKESVGFIIDGAIKYINNIGRYTYGNISSGLNLILIPNTVTIDYEGQLQSGGFLRVGNKRYAVSLLTESLEGTNFSKLSQPIPVFAANTNNPTNILGNAAGEGSSKANQIRISGIDPDVFPLIQVAVVEYEGGSFTGSIIGRYSVPVGGELVVTHYGNETGAENLDITLLNQLTADIQSAKNIEILENRLIRANITATSEYDLTEWAQESKYRLKKGIMTAVGSGENPVFGEYQNPENVFRFSSGMLKETYRIGCQLEDAETGVWTRVYHIGDFKFDTAAIGGRRLETLLDYNLTDTPTPPNDATETYYFYLTLEGFDWDFVLPNGKTIRNQYRNIRFSRAEINTRTVLQTGVLSTKSSAGVSNRVNVNPTYLSAAGTGTTPTTAYIPIATDVLRQAGVLFSPDTIIGGQDIAFISGDELHVFGQPLFQKLRATGGGSSTLGSATLTELYGAVAPVAVEHNLSGIQPISLNELVTIVGVDIRGDGEVAGVGTGLEIRGGNAFVINTTFITDTAALMANDYGIYYYQYYRPSTNQYGSPENNQWIDLSAIFSIDTSSLPTTQYDFYLQDCFTQKTYIDLYEPNNSAAHSKIIGFYSQNIINSQLRFEDGTDAYIFPKAQGSNAPFDNRINEVTISSNKEPYNYNLGYSYPVRVQSEVGYDVLFPKQGSYPTRVIYSAFKPSGSLVDYFRTFLPLDFYDQDEKFGELLSIKAINGELYTWQERAMYRQFFSTRAEFRSADGSQTIVVGSGSVFTQRGRMISAIGLTHKWGINLVKTNKGYDAVYWINTNLGKLMRFAGDGSRVVSENEAGGSRMRAFLAKNLQWTLDKDTPADNEGIHIGANLRYSEIYLTVRAKKTTAEYVGATTYNLGESVIYTPNLYERNFEQTGEIYEYINASPASGNLPTDTSYWKKIEHSNNKYYNEYTLVYDEDRNTFECFYHVKPTIWETWNNNIYSSRPVGTRSRMYIHDREKYGLWYPENGETLSDITKNAGSFSISGNGTAFLSEFQKGYGILANGNTLFVISASSNTAMIMDDIYIDANGDVQTGAQALSFTAAAYTPISQQLRHGYIEVVFNIEPQSLKDFSAILADTALMPYRVDFLTNTQASYLLRSDGDFTDRSDGDFFISPIKNDITGTGINSGDTSRLRGQWIKVGFTFRYLEEQEINAIIVKMRINQRNFNR